jgi:hypothetical protein
MQRHKPSPVIELVVSENKKSSTPLIGKKGRMAAWIILVLVLISTALWVGGFWQNLFAGPNIPLPRQTSQLTLGLNLEQVLQLYPGVQKELRPYNNDPLFRIADLTPSDGLPSNLSGLSVLFFKDQLYYVLSSWEGTAAQAIPVDDWVHQYRRWNLRGGQGEQSQVLGGQNLLREWYFSDSKTEMVLRTMNYENKIQRWQDLRDASNTDAQAAFAKYRLDNNSH